METPHKPKVQNKRKREWIVSKSNARPAEEVALEVEDLDFTVLPIGNDELVRGRAEAEGVGAVELTVGGAGAAPCADVRAWWGGASACTATQHTAASDAATSNTRQ